MATRDRRAAYIQDAAGARRPWPSPRADKRIKAVLYLTMAVHQSKVKADKGAVSHLIS